MISKEENYKITTPFWYFTHYSKEWNQTSIPSTNEQIKKTWYMYIKMDTFNSKVMFAKKCGCTQNI